MRAILRKLRSLFQGSRPTGQFGVSPNPRISPQTQLETASAGLVERARVGDQNAMAMLHEVSIAAKGGNAQAMAALQTIKSYINSHPVTSISGEETVADDQAARKLNHFTQTEDLAQYVKALLIIVPAIQNSDKAAVVLSHGPDLWACAERLAAIASAFQNDSQKKAFALGVANSGNTEQIMSFGSEMGAEDGQALNIGYCVGIARRIQAVRRPDMSIAIISKAAANELET